jgi:endonuclease YncB( thermonuclease family)
VPMPTTWCRRRRRGRRAGAAAARKPKPRAQTIDARITNVVDGDTVEVRAYGAKRRFYTVRLIGGLFRHSVG